MKIWIVFIRMRTRAQEGECVCERGKHREREYVNKENRGKEYVNEGNRERESM